MLRYMVFFIFFLISCSQSFVEETQNIVSIPSTVTYNSTDIGISLKWDIQWDFYEIEILRGENSHSLDLFKTNLVQSFLTDSDTSPGRDYYYQIRALNNKGRTIGQSSVLKGYRSYRSSDVITKPEKLSTYPGLAADRVEIYWLGDERSTYRIYRKSKIDLRNNDFQFIAEVNFKTDDDLKFIDTDVIQDSKYIYTVATVGQDANNNIKELFADSEIEGSTKKAPGSVTASINDRDHVGGIVVSWQQEPNNEYYQVYRSTEEDGEYSLIAPFVNGTNYIDKNLPELSGTMVDGAYTYPSYYYRVKAKIIGGESALSVPTLGRAIDPKDFFPAPKNFTLELKKFFNSTAKFFELQFNWEAPSGVQGDYYYQLIRVTADNITNVLVPKMTDTSFALDISPTDEEYFYYNMRGEYIVRAVNPNAGDLGGENATRSYTHITPGPPLISDTSLGARAYITSIQNVSIPFYAYWWEKPFFGSWQAKGGIVGDVKKEWVVTSEVGYINVKIRKFHTAENLAYYTLYRRKVGEKEYRMIKDNIPVTSYEIIYKDKDFTPEELEGTGFGQTFKYPKYEYRAVAHYGGQESLLGGELKTGSATGFAINPADILPAPSYFTIPGHWALGTGFNAQGFKSRKWRVGENSPKGASKIDGRGGNDHVNHLYLTWDTVSEALVDNKAKYRLRVSTGASQESWYNLAGLPDGIVTAAPNEEVYRANNETTQNGYTKLFTAEEFFAGYMPQAASFDIAAINQRANIEGDKRGMLFVESSTNPY